MKPLFRFFVLSLCVSALLGCAAALVPYSSDPKTKLAWATALIEEQGRPIPAERLIREAIEIYQTQKDELGLAEAYRVYGIFFKSNLLDIYEDFYRKNGFYDKTVNFDQRLDKAIEYFGKSRDIFASTKSHDDRVSNIEFLMAFVYERKKDREKACNALDNSVAYHEKFKAANPDANIMGDRDNHSYEEVIARGKKFAKCP